MKRKPVEAPAAEDTECAVCLETISLQSRKWDLNELLAVKVVGGDGDHDYTPAAASP